MNRAEAGMEAGRIRPFETENDRGKIEGPDVTRVLPELESAFRL